MCMHPTVFIKYTKMQALLFVSVLVATIILGTEAKYTDRTCTAAGLSCKDCETVKLCTRDGSNYKEEIIGKCDYFSETCFNGECVKGIHPICDSKYENFPCQSAGYFPDPYNCQMYHNCTAIGAEIIDQKLLCQDRFSYNTRTQKCDLLLPRNQCYFTMVPLCKTIGQHGIVSGDKSMYFICKTGDYYLFPYLYKCPFNQVYDGNYGCY